MAIPTTLEDHVEAIRMLQGALLDAWVVVRVDERHTVVAYNRPFFALFPRRVARSLEGRPWAETMRFVLGGQPLDLIQVSLDHPGRGVRYDEVRGHIHGEDSAHGLNLIAAGAPLLGRQGQPLGVLFVLRDVTDEAEVQTKYQQILTEEAQQREGLEEQLRRRTEELLEANDSLNAMQQELMAYKKGLRVDR
ncbi:MAG: hypothetical protein AAFX99_01800 [Myxococcota bacterium]